MLRETIGEPAGPTDGFWHETGDWTLVSTSPTRLVFEATIVSGRFAGETATDITIGSFNLNLGTGRVTDERQLVRGQIHFSMHYDGLVRLENYADDWLALIQSGVIFRGNSFANTCWGDIGNDQLSGGAGNDRLYAYEGVDRLDGGPGADLMDGGAGGDTYFFDNTGDGAVEVADGGVDLVNSSVSVSALSPNVERLTLTGAANLNAIGNALGNVLRGNAAANALNGGAGNDAMLGLAGNDRLNGSAGADAMQGGPGNDTCWVDSARDRVAEEPGAGIDTVLSTIGYALATSVENLTLIGTAAVNGLGNGLPNLLRGNAADNALNGGAGADTMQGGAGNDTYWIDTARDRVDEAPNAGIDTVVSTIGRALGANVENLTLAGTAAINGIGNGLANLLRGNAADNALNGGAGADRMQGGAGNDTYRIDHFHDRVTEAADAGNDTILSTVTRALPDNVENLTLAGTAAINGSGNALANVLRGNSGDNILNGGRAHDLMLGGLGNDTYWIDHPADRVTEAAGQGNDTIVSTITRPLPDNVEDLTLIGTAAINGSGNVLANTLEGNAADNTLAGGDGDDRLLGGGGSDRQTGGSGADTFAFLSVDESSGPAVLDAIADFSPGIDKIDLSAIDADAVSAGDQAFDFIGAQPFSNAPAQLRYADGLLEGDVTGDGIADLQIEIANLATPTESDFLL
jgi:Ca2+-binding RTX toxin-like protein